MKIVHITNAGGFGRAQSGGAERAVAELATALAEKHGRDESIIAPNEYFADRAIGETVKRYPVELADFGLRKAMSPNAPLRSLLREIDPDLVLTHLLRGTLVGLPAAAASTTAKRVSILHNSLHDYRADPSHRRAKGVANALAFRLVAKRYADMNVAISEANRRDLIEADHIAAEQTITIHNWVSERFSLKARERRDAIRADLKIDADAPMILVSGRLEHQKNQEQVLRLLPELAGVHLVFAGEGELGPTLLESSRAMGVSDRVHLVGFFQRIEELIGAADVVAVPSRFEGFGRSIVESIAVGTPVVASDLPAVREVLAGCPAESSAIVPEEDDRAWEVALSGFLDRGDSAALPRQAMSEFVESNYSLDAAAGRYDGLFCDLLGEPRSATQPRIETAGER